MLSTQPGRLAHVHPVTLPFPRALADSYAPEATALIGRMREEIRTVRPGVRR